MDQCSFFIERRGNFITLRVEWLKNHAYGFRSLAFFAAFFSLQKLFSRGTNLDIVSVPPRLSFSDVRKADYSKQ
jgi:hypothetical protein